jgi:hypothetical protein
MDFKILIPSYHRHKRQDTLELLSSNVFPQRDIIISTQDANDFKMYQSRWGEKATIIYRKGDCVGDNRNNLLDYCEKNGVSRALMLDDDIKSFRTITGARLNTPEQIRNCAEQCFKIAEKHNASIWGVYMTDNKLCMKNTISKNKLIVGMVTGFLDTSLRYNRMFRIKEDYELCLRLISQGKTILRFNSFSASARHKTGGGGAKMIGKMNNLKRLQTCLRYNIPN